MSDSVAELVVNGKSHKGWTDIAITRSLEQFAHTFDIAFAEQWTDLKDPIPIRAGDECQVKLNGKKVLDGFVDDDSITEAVGQHEMRVAGRSRTGDLVDCSAIYKKGSWKNATLKDIAENLCSDFNIKVSADSSLGDMGGPFPRFSIQDGETVFDTLDRACRMRGVLMVTDIQGDLRFTASGFKKTTTVIKRGVNVISSGRSGSWQNRFSQYTLKAQAAGGPDLYGRDAANQKFTVKDTEALRYRPTIIKAEVTGGGTKAKLEARAKWEMNIRAGRSVRLHYELDGWENAEGIWEPNTIVKVQDNLLQVDTYLLVISTSQVKGRQSGTRTMVELADPKSVTLEPLTKQPKGTQAKSLYLVGQQ